jgi:FkbM family methyltransferase
MDIKTVLDVGAWKGDSVKSFHALFPEARIYSFEPLSDCFAELKKLEGAIPQLKAINFALGNSSERMKINRSGFTPSSSLLKMNALHKEAFPFTAEETIEEIEVRTLDSFSNEINLVSNVLLKIDVQGFEENVLKGAVETLKKVKIIIVELTFVKLYEGQPMFDKIYKHLTDQGFAYSGSWHQLLNPNDGTICQQNGIFINTNS